MCLDNQNFVHIIYYPDYQINAGALTNYLNFFFFDYFLTVVCRSVLCISKGVFLNSDSTPGNVTIQFGRNVIDGLWSGHDCFVVLEQLSAKKYRHIT